MPEPVVIALDPARALGCAVGSIGGVPKLTSIKLGGDGTPDEEVFGAGARVLDALINDAAPVLVTVERPFYKTGESNYGTTVLLHGLYGALVGMARAHEIIVWPVAVASWRAVALGTSKFASQDAGKKASLAMCKRLGWDAADDNAADAGGIWMWATAKYAPYGVLPDQVSATIRTGGII